MTVDSVVEIVTLAPAQDGRSGLVVKQDGVVIDTDQLDLRSSAEREQVASRLCQKFRQLDRDELLSKLEQRACQMASPSSCQPSPPTVPIDPFAPFPTHTLPSPVRELVVVGADAIGCDASYIALPALAVMGAAIGNTRRLTIKRGWYVPPILWTAVVGESGTAKTPAFKLALRAMRLRQQRQMEHHADAMLKFQAEYDQWEMDHAAWKRSRTRGSPSPQKPEPPQPERCLVSDVTVESLAPILLANHRGLLMARDELAGWIGSFDRYTSGKGGSDSAHWLSVHSGESIIVDRKTGIPRTIFVPQAAICICGGIQPEILRRVLSREHRESGLAARLLFACPPRRAKRWTEADIDPQIEQDYASAIDNYFSCSPRRTTTIVPRRSLSI